MISVIYPLAMCLTAIGIFLLGIFVFIKNYRLEVNQIWFLFCLSVTIWAFGYYLTMVPRFSLSEALIFSRVSHASGALIPAFFFHFVLAWLSFSRGLRKLIKICYSFCGIIGVLSLTPFVVTTMTQKLVFKYYPVGEIGYLLYILNFIFWVIMAHYYLIISYRELSSYRRNQIKFFLVGTIVGYLGGVSCFPLIFDIKIAPYPSILMLFYVFTSTYAIFKYRLMDINVALTRAGIFAFVYSFVAIIPFWLAPKFLNSSFWWFSILLMGLLASSGPFIYQYLRRRAENILLKEQYRYQRAVTDLTRTIAEIRDFDTLLDTETSTVTKEVKIGFCAMYVKQEEYKSFQLKSVYPNEVKPRFSEFIPYDDILAITLSARKKPLLSEEIGKQDKIALDSGLAIPCFGKDGLIVIIILGAKPNNAMFTNADVLAFENLSYATSLAIENCRFWKEIEDRQRKARLTEMDTFAYSLAHEIDNPMTVMLNLSKFLKNYFLKYVNAPEEQKEVEDTCNYLVEASQRASGMVKAIRQFGGKTAGEFIAITLQEAVESMGERS